VSHAPKDPKDEKSTPKPMLFPTPDATALDWPRWYHELRVATADHDAVTRDLLRRPRNRDLGVREAKRLYRDARDKLRRLFAQADRAGGGGNEESRGDPAGLGGSPAD
jgi:hypothetical protein